MTISLQVFILIATVLVAGTIAAAAIFTSFNEASSSQSVSIPQVSLSGGQTNSVGAFAITVKNTGITPISCTTYTCLISFAGTSPSYTGNSRPSVIAFGTGGTSWIVPFTYDLNAYWPLYEGSGNYAYDGSGNGHTGTLACSGSGCTKPTWIAGGGLTFTTTSTTSNGVALGQMTGTLGYTGGSPYTVFDSFSITSFSYAGTQQLNKFYSCNSCDGGFTISISSTNVVLYQYSAGHTTTCTSSIPYTISAGTTYDMAVVLNYQGSNGQWALYMNGNYVNSNNSCPNYSVTAVSQTASLGPNYAATTTGLDGNVYSLYYFSRALPAGEIAALGNYNPTSEAALAPGSAFTLNPGSTVSVVFQDYFLGTNANGGPASGSEVTVQLSNWGSAITETNVLVS